MTILELHRYGMDQSFGHLLIVHSPAKYFTDLCVDYLHVTREVNRLGTKARQCRIQ